MIVFSSLSSTWLLLKDSKFPKGRDGIASSLYPLHVAQCLIHQHHPHHLTHIILIVVVVLYKYQLELSHQSYPLILVLQMKKTKAECDKIQYQLIWVRGHALRPHFLPQEAVLLSPDCATTETSINLLVLFHSPMYILTKQAGLIRKGWKFQSKLSLLAKTRLRNLRTTAKKPVCTVTIQDGAWNTFPSDLLRNFPSLVC